MQHAVFLAFGRVLLDSSTLVSLLCRLFIMPPKFDPNAISVGKAALDCCALQARYHTHQLF